MKALVLMADGTEEMEAVITCDILVRAGIHVTRASVGVKHGEAVHCANGMKLLADMTLDEAMGRLGDYVILILPGGSKGSDTFSHDQNVQHALKTFAASPKCRVAAICAAPLALRQAEIFKGARITCYPSLEEKVTRGGLYTHSASEITVVDGNLITSQGPGTACDFALHIVKALKGEEMRAKVAAGLLLH